MQTKVPRLLGHNVGPRVWGQGAVGKNIDELSADMPEKLSFRWNIWMMPMAFMISAGLEKVYPAASERKDQPSPLC